ncbi:MAG: VanZ family protein [Roseburia inulinivorans]
MGKFFHVYANYNFNKNKDPSVDFKKILLYIICFNLVIEILQFLTLQGSFDVDDILLRLFGAWISYAVYSSFRRKTFK